MGDGSGGLEREIYTFDEVVDASTKYFKGDGLAADTWTGKYALKDFKERFYELTPDDMHHRLAREFARIENEYPNPMSEDQIYSLLKDFKYIIPQGSPQAGIGNDLQVVSLSNCFVIGNNFDSYGGIMYTDQEQIQLMKRRGGVGHDLSYLRPRDSPVNNSSLKSTGVPAFMERYSHSTGEVAQEGRRGALMLTLSIKHPDAEGFIDAKMRRGKVPYANISPRVDDKFMEAVRDGKPYVQQFPVDSENPTFTREIDARELWKKIIHNAWQSAEPGVLFWDTLLRESVSDCYADLGFKTTSTNPCGEIPLPPYDSCRLTAMNLYSYVDEPFTDNARFNFSLFREHVGYAQRMMDDIIDLEIEKADKILEKIDSDLEPEYVKAVERRLWEKIREKAVQGRRTGLGITGEGDMLAALGFRYGSEEATAFAVEVHKNLAIEAYRESVKMAGERGAFPIYDTKKEEGNPFIRRIRGGDEKLYQEMVKNGRRNIQLLTTAPTGSVSIETQTTSGLENAFKMVYTRRRKVNPSDKKVRVDYVDEETGNSWQEYKVFHHKFEEWLRVNGYDPEEVIRLHEEDREKELAEIIAKSPYHKATMEDVDWVEKIRMQGAIQKWIDHSISVTVNLPEDISEEKVWEVYMTAWEEGCKGITVYREGSRSGVLISGNGEDLEAKLQLIQFNVKNDSRLDIRDQTLKYRVRRPQNRDSLHVMVTSDLYIDDKTNKSYFIPVEIFQERAPLGESSSVSFQQSGMDRTEIFRGPNPDYVELVLRWQSASSDEEEGIGPSKIKSKEHAVGLIMENCLLANGIIDYDDSMNPPQLVNLVRKKDLRRVERGTDEWQEVMSQVRIVHTDEELEVRGNNGGKGFKCKRCGSREPLFEAGCNKPMCLQCGFGEDCG